ncbi:hypothetical protein BDFB_002936, partial [Asbolus verrucosus]
TKPKLKNHYRAHRLSFWLNLVPDLHKPGGDDVPMSHHKLLDDDPPLPKLPSLNPRKFSTTENPSDLAARTSPSSNSSLLGTIGTPDSTERVEELGVKSDPATILGHHHSHHQLPPPEFADLPQNNATLPRPPPPPKISKANVNTLSSNQVPENQPLLSTHSIQLINTGTLTKKNTHMNSKQNTMEEL